MQLLIQDPEGYGTEVLDGVEYVKRFPLWQVPIYRSVKVLQWLLWSARIKVHDHLFDECCPDFSCCKVKD